MTTCVTLLRPFLALPAGKEATALYGKIIITASKSILQIENTGRGLSLHANSRFIEKLKAMA